MLFDLNMGPPLRYDHVNASNNNVRQCSVYLETSIDK